METAGMAHLKKIKKGACLRITGLQLSANLLQHSKIICIHFFFLFYFLTYFSSSDLIHSVYPCSFWEEVRRKKWSQRKHVCIPPWRNSSLFSWICLVMWNCVFLCETTSAAPLKESLQPHYFVWLSEADGRMGVSLCKTLCKKTAAEYKTFVNSLLQEQHPRMNNL